MYTLNLRATILVINLWDKNHKITCSHHREIKKLLNIKYDIYFFLFFFG